MLPVAESVAGVCIVRDARDLIPFLCGHYLRIGFGHVAFIDDGSSDGTFEFLSRLARRTQRISVKRVFEDQCYQRVHVTETANALIATGYEIIVPFDADEFWCVEARGLEELLATQSNIAFNGE
jgi:Glycosyl transferase family 2